MIFIRWENVRQWVKGRKFSSDSGVLSSLKRHSNKVTWKREEARIFSERKGKHWSCDMCDRKGTRNRTGSQYQPVTKETPSQHPTKPTVLSGRIMGHQNGKVNIISCNLMLQTHPHFHGTDISVHEWNAYRMAHPNEWRLLHRESSCSPRSYVPFDFPYRCACFTPCSVLNKLVFLLELRGLKGQFFHWSTKILCYKHGTLSTTSYSVFWQWLRWDNGLNIFKFWLYYVRCFLFP